MADNGGLGDDLRRLAEDWIADDPDPATRDELQALLDTGDAAALEARFAGTLAFGTAGIRGAVGAGPMRMNRAVVRRVTAGVAARLAQEPGALEHGVVVGRDARHGSVAFAEDVVAVFAGAGYTVHRFEDPVPTPLVAFAVRHLRAGAGVMITASHNPPADNGYKVYWSDGAQIAEPLDAEIALAIADVGGLAAIPLSDVGVRTIDDGVREAYVDACLALVGHPETRDLRVVYTPLHGVARDLLQDVLDHAGFRDVHVVAEQGEPDPDFPTVAFPNPEEPGALDLALAQAREMDADLVIANDPDGDRIALAVPGEAGWQLLSGDETGCVLAEELLSRDSEPDRAVATTVVSSTLLREIAAHHGVRYTETLTGFKWLAQAAQQAEDTRDRFVLAYEQALGVMCGDAVRDKDGISAALVAADLAAALKAEGKGLGDALDALALRHGVHATGGRSVRLEGEHGEALVAEVLARLREEPPSDLLGVPVTATEDRKARVRVEADGTTTPLETPATELVGFELADGSRVQVRPSGTEPLLKFYVEVVEPVRGDGVGAARAAAADRLERLTDAFVTTSLGQATG